GGTSAEVLSRMPVSDYQQHMETDKLLTLADNNRLLEQLVLAIRLWRPSVVISEALEPGMPSGPLASSVAWYVRQACELAGRSDVFPEQLHELKLETWQPVRLFSQRIHANAVDAALPLNIPRPVLFAAPNDFANLGRPLVCEHFQRGPEKDTYTLVRSFTGTYSSQHPWMALLRHSGPLSMFIPPGMMPNDDLMAGLSLNHGGQARREAVDTDDLKFQLLLGATWRQQMDARPYQQKLQDPQERRKFFTNFEYTLNGLTPLTIGDRIAAQAQEFVERGQWTMARECHFMLLDLMPTHRLAPESCRFIATMMTSGEIKRRVDLNTMTHFADYVFRSPASKAGGEEAESPFQSLNPKQRTVLQRYRSELRRWYGGTQVAGSLYSVMHPLGYSEPEVQFALLASERLDGRPDPLRQTALLFKETVGTWAEAAQAEEWLQQRVGECPKPCMQAVRLQEQPKIDGKLDEAVWKKVPATELKPGAGVRSGTKVRWAYDDNHLYVALECFRHQNMPMLNPVKPRKRDDDLQAFDRISLLIDIDRDYSTAYRLEFDARGCVREDCCGDVTWNPRWFVEVQPTETGWTAEVAIPLVELTGMDKLENEAWAASVTRIVPGLGLESTSLPASVKPIPGSMGLLLFGDSVVQTGAK
ncbi:MAG TPA: carbohydrate binding family 9 domain-containing protein, partial [Gemmatales bacterium]|nr:carbohydrate binding family 9 domain-containing protein [Gemmatales bacterium]